MPAAQSPYRYYGVDVITGNQLIEVPLVSVQANLALNTPGAFQASMPLAGFSRGLQQAYITATEEDRCSIAVVRNGLLLGEWRITSRPNWANNGAPIQIQGEQISGVFANGIPAWSTNVGDLPASGYAGPTTTPPGAGTDPMQIAYDLFAQYQDPIIGSMSPAGSRGLAITLPSRAGLNSGQLVGQTDWATQSQTILAMVTTLSQSYDFDWNVDVAIIGGKVVRTLTLSYPMRGVDAGVTVLQPEQGGQGGQVTDYQANTGPRRATQVITTGASAGAGSTLIARSPNAALVAGYPLKQVINAQTNTTDPTQLQAQSDAYAAYVSSSAIPPKITILADGTPTLGSYTPGDVLTVMVGVSDNFPAGVVQKIRITNILITPPVAGAEVVQLTVTLP